VLYDSASGNTEKMARLVAEGAGSISGIEVRLRKVRGGNTGRHPLVRWGSAG
jgi:multimeric flavodoxin WrbA